MEKINVGEIEIEIIKLDTAIIGSGCAGFNAADCLYDLGERDIAIITEGINMGTSRNTGSDKQTYYKLSIASAQEDSIERMAQTLASGLGVNGECALVEAACSLKAFFKLVQLGVPFPTNSYGEYVGYKTDHDPRQRATSVGPLTSKIMTEALEKSVVSKGIRIYDHTQAVRLLTHKGRIIGVLAIARKKYGQENRGYVLFKCKNVILATGGPAGVYWSSVYPRSQSGMTGMAIEAGASLANFQEWQFGLASTLFRWNVSGTYQQVLPRYISISASGEEREFLNDYFDRPEDAVDMVFLKGYQWPFDVKKINGSSLIDLIVHHETAVKGNKIYLDFTRNPSCVDENGFDGLSETTKEYLKNSKALFGTPIQRLEKMNKSAVELYACHNIDITSEPLEIAVCAQHCNGGIRVDANWETDIKGMYAAGEVAGTFGVYRPGGSALNSTQVGSMRAAEHIAWKEKTEEVEDDVFFEEVRKQAGDYIKQSLYCCGSGKTDLTGPEKKGFKERYDTLRMNMSRSCAHIKNMEEFAGLREKIQNELDDYFKQFCEPCQLAEFLRCRDMMISQIAVIDSSASALNQFGSRGSSFMVSKDGMPVAKSLPEYRYVAEKPVDLNKTVITRMEDGKIYSKICDVVPIPHGDDWFENVWNDYKRRTKK